MLLPVKGMTAPTRVFDLREGAFQRCRVTWRSGVARRPRLSPLCRGKRRACRVTASTTPSAPPPPYLPSRRALLALGEAALELTGAAYFEYNFRVKPDGGQLEENAASGSGPVAAVRSLLPQATTQEAAAEAESLLDAARRSVSAGDDGRAVELYSRVLQTAPNKYKLCQQALRERAESLGKLDRKEEQRQDGVQVQ